MPFELRYKINRFHFESILITYSKSLAYGMRKKLTKEQPQTYQKKLIVKTIK